MNDDTKWILQTLAFFVGIFGCLPVLYFSQGVAMVMLSLWCVGWAVYLLKLSLNL